MSLSRLHPVLVFLPLFFATGALRGSTPSDPMLLYLAGVRLLKESGLPQGVTSRAYRELTLKTGIEAGEAQMFIRRYLQRPEEWSDIQEKIGALYDELADYRRNENATTRLHSKDTPSPKGDDPHLNPEE